MIGLAAAASMTAMATQSLRAEDLDHQSLQQRAVTAAIWGMPIVSVNAMRQAFFRRRCLLVEAVGLEEPDDHSERVRALCLFQL